MSQLLHRLEEIGVALWNRRREDPLDVPELISPHSWRSAPENFTEQVLMTLALNWVDEGAVKLTTSHTFAAALAATEASLEAWGGEELHLPAKTFVVLLPEKVVEINGRSIAVILFMLHANSFYMALRDSENKGIQGFNQNFDFEDFFRDGVDEFPHGEAPWDDPEENCKVYVLCRRIVLGLLFTLQFTPNFREKSFGKKRGKKREGPPDHRVFFVGKAVSVDCRPILREWLSKDGDPRGPQAFQTVVRGHYKRQVVGVGRSGRRVIWIEPYWRGPEDAPILSRPLHVETKVAES